MRSFLLLAVGLYVCCPLPARAGNIYGSLWQDGKAIQGAQIEITCPTQKLSTQTDSNGAYRISAPSGRCTLTVTSNGHSAQTDIASYDNPIKYDFDLVRQGALYILKRK